MSEAPQLEAEKKTTEENKEDQEPKDAYKALDDWFNKHRSLIHSLATAAIVDDDCRLIMICLDKAMNTTACDRLSDTMAQAMFPNDYPQVKASAILEATRVNLLAKTLGGTGNEYDWFVVLTVKCWTKRLIDWSYAGFQRRRIHVRRTDTDEAVRQLSFKEITEDVFKAKPHSCTKEMCKCRLGL